MGDILEAQTKITCGALSNTSIAFLCKLIEDESLKYRLATLLEVKEILPNFKISSENSTNIYLHDFIIFALSLIQIQNEFARFGIKHPCLQILNLFFA